MGQFMQFIVVLSVFMLSVFILNVVAPKLELKLTSAISGEEIERKIGKWNIYWLN
jgi:hypothetical protein